MDIISYTDLDPNSLVLGDLTSKGFELLYQIEDDCIYGLEFIQEGSEFLMCKSQEFTEIKPLRIRGPAISNRNTTTVKSYDDLQLNSVMACINDELLKYLENI